MTAPIKLAAGTVVTFVQSGPLCIIELDDGAQLYVAGWIVENSDRKRVSDFFASRKIDGAWRRVYRGPDDEGQEPLWEPVE